MAREFQPYRNEADGYLPPDDVIFGRSSVMQDLKRKLERICSATVPVSLQGEVGVGKYILSRFIHRHSAGIDGPYVRVNCATLSDPTPLLDLFAPRKWNLTGTAASDDGEKIHHRPGTLFLDEVTKLSPSLQRRLSQALAGYDHGETRDQQKLCGKMHIICASTRNLRQEMKLGRFWRELFDRLVVVTVDVPPLRERLDDLPQLCEYLRAHYTTQVGAADTPFPDDLLARVLTYSWPGNIPELQRFVCQYVELGPDRCTVG